MGFALSIDLHTLPGDDMCLSWTRREVAEEPAFGTKEWTGASQHISESKIKNEAPRGAELRNINFLEDNKTDNTEVARGKKTDARR